MRTIRAALERFGRRLTTLVSRPRKPGPVADIELDAAGRNGETAGLGPGGSLVGAPDEPDASFRNRARLRRRLRYLRQTRELGFRDLGGFMFDAKRLGRERADIVDAKLEGLVAIDREVRALEFALDDAQDVTLLREPGISVCPRCGALHGSEDNYCSSCALPVGRSLGLAIAQGGPGGAALSAQQAHGAQPAVQESPAAANEPAEKPDSERPAPKEDSTPTPNDSGVEGSEAPSVSKP